MSIRIRFTVRVGMNCCSIGSKGCQWNKCICNRAVTKESCASGASGVEHRVKYLAKRLVSVLLEYHEVHPVYPQEGVHKFVLSKN